MFRRILGLVAVAALIVPVAAVAAPSDPLQDRVTELEKRVAALEAALAGEWSSTTQPGSSSTIASTAGPTSSTIAQTTTTAAAASSTAAPVTTAAPQTPTTAGVTGTAITGTTCPGMVHGVATLVGNVSLTCDLMVMGSGAVLKARPGVNVTGNGFQIMFMDGARADFQGTPVATWSNDGKTQNRTRDIVFSGMKRIMFHQGAGPSILKYFSVIDSGTSAKGDYPIHFHLNGNSTRGTLVEGVVVINGRHRAFVPHGSHGITFKDTIAYNTRGDAYWWDPDASSADHSNDIVYDHALADGVTVAPGDEHGFRLAGFSLRDGKGNVVRNSAAINIKPVNVKDCSGFHWPEDAESVWVFTNNYSSSPSGCHGIFTWQNDEAPHVINGFRGGGIDHGAYANKYAYRDVSVSYLEIHAGGWTMTGGQVNTVTAMEHSKVTPQNPTVTFTNTKIGKFVINNGDGSRYGVYILNGTGMSCASIVRQSVFPGTKVIIDGKNC